MPEELVTAVDEVEVACVDTLEEAGVELARVEAVVVSSVLVV